MKILIVTNYLPPKIGGIERHTFELACALHKREGTEVTVAHSPWTLNESLNVERDTKFDFNTSVIPSITIFGRLPLPKLFSLDYWKYIVSLRSDFDVVLFQSHLFMNNWFTSVFLRNIGRRVWLNHSPGFIPMKSRFGKFVVGVYELIGISVMKKSCNEFVAQSNNASDWISGITDIRFRIFPNALNLSYFKNRETEFTRNFGTSVLYVGRFIEGKGLRESIRLVADANKLLRLKKKSEQFTLTVIGSGPIDPLEIAKQYDLEIVWLGEMQYADVISRMFKCDILVQAYPQPDCLTTVTLEALGAGMIVISTPLSGDKDLERLKNCVLDQLEALPERLVSLLETSKDRLNYYRSGQSFIAKNYAWDVVSNQLISGEYQSRE
jgi:glycosyltransferase involved in cell wall biosynthesis